ncbi:MAG TPA: hypothetical protein VML75_05615 [Kofleriaceae bacterium]|nr:hypothetical protein [Kofleriaceae bacterium]
MTHAPLLSILVSGLVAGIAGTTSTAHAGQVRYVGGHPADHGGYCHIEASHVHVYAPAKGNKKHTKLLYRMHDQQYHFVGDPAAHHYDGPRVSYYGHHPIALDVVAGDHVEGAPHDVTYCYLDGPHFHAYAPAPSLEFTVKGDANWYVGTYPAEYERDRVALVRVNAIYRPMKYQRPVIEVEPPAAYVGPIFVVGAPAVIVETPVRSRGVVRGSVGVDVHIPAPSIEIGIGLPGVVVVEEHHHHRKYKHRKYKKHKKHKRHRR